MEGGAWWATVHGVAKSWTRLSDFSFTFFHGGPEPLERAPTERSRRESGGRRVPAAQQQKREALTSARCARSPPGAEGRTSYHARSQEDAVHQPSNCSHGGKSFSRPDRLHGHIR